MDRARCSKIKLSDFVWLTCYLDDFKPENRVTTDARIVQILNGERAKGQDATVTVAIA